jgi:hypothetical protein
LSVTLREVHRLRVFENTPMRIFGPKTDDMTGGWRKVHVSYSSPNIIRMTKPKRLRLAGFVTYTGK